MAADPILVVRVAARMDEFRKNLLEGIQQIETTKTHMASMANAFDGSKIASQAGAVMAQIQALGGVTNLTAGEQARANRILEEALEKYEALGRIAPPGMRELAEATRKVEEATARIAGPFESIEAHLERVRALAGQLGGDNAIQSAHEYVAAVEQIGGAARLTAEQQEQVNQAVTAGVAAYEQMGQTAPASLLELASATKAVEEATTRVAGPFESIEAHLGRVNALASRFGGDTAIQSAHEYMKAVDAIGGAAMLTAGQQGEVNRVVREAMAVYRNLGEKAPPEMIALAQATQAVGDASEHAADAAANAEKQTSLFDSTFAKLTASFTAANLIDKGVSSLIAWGSAAFSAASETVNLADKTGLSTTTIQEMAHVASQTGTTLDAFTNSAFQLGVRLAGGKDSVVEATRALGLEWSTLKELSPDEQFNKVVKALGEMENPQERNRVALELLGKAGSEILPAIAQGYRDIADQARVSGEEQIRSVSAAGDAWSKFKTDAGSAITSAVGNFILASQWLGTIGLRMSGMSDEIDKLTKSQKQSEDQTGANAEAVEGWGSRLLAATETVYGLTRAKIDQIEVAKRMGATVKDLERDFGLTADAVRVLDERLRAEADAAREAARATAERTKEEEHAATVGLVWGDVINGIIQSTGEAINGQSAYRSELKFTTETIVEQTSALDELIKKQEEEAEKKKKAAEKEAERTRKLFADAGGTSDIGALTALQLAGLRGNEAANMLKGTNGDENILAKLRELEAAADRPRKNVTADDHFAMVEEQILLAQLRQWAQGQGIPGYAGGVENHPGGMAIVGERGPELLNLPRGSSVTPNHQLGGTNVTFAAGSIVIQNGGGIDHLADQLMAAIMRKMRAQGFREPVGA